MLVNLTLIVTLLRITVCFTAKYGTIALNIKQECRYLLTEEFFGTQFLSMESNNAYHDSYGYQLWFLILKINSWISYIDPLYRLVFLKCYFAKYLFSRTMVCLNMTRWLLTCKTINNQNH